MVRRALSEEIRASHVAQQLRRLALVKPDNLNLILRTHKVREQTSTIYPQTSIPGWDIHVTPPEHRTRKAESLVSW